MVEAPQAFMKPYTQADSIEGDGPHCLSCICRKPAFWCVEMRKPLFSKSRKRLLFVDSTRENP